MPGLRYTAVATSLLDFRVGLPLGLQVVLVDLRLGGPEGIPAPGKGAPPKLTSGRKPDEVRKRFDSSF